jgi:hypothetical protein
MGRAVSSGDELEHCEGQKARKVSTLVSNVQSREVSRAASQGG